MYILLQESIKYKGTVRRSNICLNGFRRQKCKNGAIKNIVKNNI